MRNSEALRDAEASREERGRRGHRPPVAFVLALVWALVAAADQIRCVDAARAGARAAARSEPEAMVRAAAREAAPARAEVAVERVGELWRVRVETPTPGPGPLALTLAAEAVALAEDTVGAAP